MDVYEQHNEVSTSFNNNNLKHNYNECKNDFYQYVDVTYLDKEKAEKDFYDERNYKVKIEEPNQNLTTPFLVKDILNINQTNYNYDRNEVWKYNERDRRPYDYEPVYQNQGYCPAEYFNQVYPNVSVPNFDPYWTQEYHDHKVDDYYNYNAYGHNIYHQSYDQYSDGTSLHVSQENTLKIESAPSYLNHVERESIPTSSERVENEKNLCSQFSSDPIVKGTDMCRKNTSKGLYFLFYSYNISYKIHK